VSLKLEKEFFYRSDYTTTPDSVLVSLYGTQFIISDLFCPAVVVVVQLVEQLMTQSLRVQM